MFKLFLLLSLTVSSAWARELTVEQKLNDLTELTAQIRSGYGPLQYKEKNYGISINALYEKYSGLVKESKTNTEFYYLIVKYIAEFNDSHFGASLPTTLETYLGFTSDLVQGKVVIDVIDRKILTQEAFPFSKGDEIISIDGISAKEELQELATYMGQGYELTSLRKAASNFSIRRASKVPAKDGKSVLEIRRGDSKLTDKVTVTWLTRGTYVDEFKPAPKTKALSSAGVNYDSISIDDAFRCSGNTRINIPAKATVILKEPFVAYHYPTAKGNVGYLRIPHYSWGANANQVLKQYEYAVKTLQKNTVGLVIDQDHNCGGSVAWLHSFMSLFMDRPFQPMQFELLASKASYLDFASWADSTAKATIEYDDVAAVRDLIKDTWLNTDNYLTKKTSIDGSALTYPNPINYTKPILILIDEMSGSGGDAFPSMMKGYGRAKLLGTRTMGAGGHVIELPNLSNSQIKVRMTKSLFYRPDDVAVENNGAEPDIAYSPSINDLKYGYNEYQAFFTDELLKMLE